jgi:hypothetical protein
MARRVMQSVVVQSGGGEPSGLSALRGLAVAGFEVARCVALGLVLGCGIAVGTAVGWSERAVQSEWSSLRSGESSVVGSPRVSL